MRRRSSTASVASTSSPSTRTVPASGSVIRLKQRSSVLFPDPLSPTSATHSPGATSSDTPASAAVAP